MKYDPIDCKKVLKIASDISLKNDQILLNDTKLNNQQIFNLLKKLHFYLDIDEKCIDKNGPHF